MPLNPRQRAFVAALIAGKTKGQAAIDAGYSPKTAPSQACDLLKNPKIQAALSEAQGRVEARAEVSAAEVLKELKTFAHSDPLGLVDEDGKLKALKDMAPEVRKSIASIEIEELFEGRGENRQQIGVLKKVKLWPKDRGLELEGKHLKMWIDRVEHSADSSFADLLKAARERARRR